MVRFAAARVRIADGAPHMPGEDVWLIGEHRSNGERKYDLSNLPGDTSVKEVAGAIKAGWICEQATSSSRQSWAWTALTA
jgi:hypothetical protein